jgi:hypothetical protein
VRAPLAAVVAALLVVACSSGDDLPRPSRAFCDAAYRYEQRIQRAPRASVDTQIDLVADMAAHAPADIRADARLFLAALRRAKAGTLEKDDPRVVAAVENVNRRAGNGCGFFERDSGSGF